MNPEAMQKPIANERGYDADCCIADEAEPRFLGTILPASYPAMTPTAKMISNRWSDRCVLFSWALRIDEADFERLVDAFRKQRAEDTP